MTSLATDLRMVALVTAQKRLPRFGSRAEYSTKLELFAPSRPHGTAIFK
jgi:hypothetical protein